MNADYFKHFEHFLDRDEMDEVYNELTNKDDVVKVCSAIYYLFHVPTFVWVYRLPVYQITIVLNFWAMILLTLAK